VRVPDVRLDDVAAQVERLFADVLVAWPDVPPTPADELTWCVLFAPPRARPRILGAVRDVFGAAESLWDALVRLDVVALRAGQDGDGETCAALLDLGTALRDWGDQ
jgi:hypothetical protein